MLLPRLTLLLLLLPWLHGCRDYEPIRPSPDRTDVTIAELRNDRSYDDQQVRLPRAIVLAHDTFDESGAGQTGTVHLVDPGNEPASGLQAFGPQVQLPPGEHLRAGNLVEVTGTFVRFRGPGCETSSSGCFGGGRRLPQLTIGAVIQRTGFWRDPEPITLSVDEYLSKPGRYVGSLITLEGLEASEGYSEGGGGTRVNPFGTAEGVNVSAELYMIPGVTSGTRIEQLTGVASYFFDDFVMPRGPRDVEIVEGTRLEQGVLCGDGIDNDDNGNTDCGDPSCAGAGGCGPAADGGMPGGGAG